LLKNFMGKIRIPCLDDTVSSEAATTAMNHIFAGTMARTLSQSCSSKEDEMAHVDWDHAYATDHF
jgi:hypothetical protein